MKDEEKKESFLKKHKAYAIATVITPIVLLPIVYGAIFIYKKIKK